MKIFFVIDRLGAGGKERQLVELLKGLDSIEGYQGYLMVLSDISHYETNFNRTQVHYEKRKVAKDPAILKKIYQVCRTFKPDIIHSWELMCSVYTVPVAKLLGIKFVNGIIRNAPVIKPFGKLWTRYKLTFPLSDVILANSMAGLECYKVPPKKSHCIYNGFDFSRVIELDPVDKVRERFRIVTPKVVGMVGKFIDKKDYETYIHAALQILETRDDVTFMGIGDGIKLESCRAMIPERHKPYVKFPGNQKDVESIVNIFHVGVLATFTEGLSNSIMEYMALGKPVVATDGGGTRELVLDRQNGFLVKVSDAADLVEKITWLLDHPDDAVRMGKKGRERLESDFNLARMTDQFTDLYRKTAPNANGTVA